MKVKLDKQYHNTKCFNIIINTAQNNNLIISQNIGQT